MKQPVTGYCQSCECFNIISIMLFAAWKQFANHLTQQHVHEIIDKHVNVQWMRTITMSSKQVHGSQTYTPTSQSKPRQPVRKDKIKQEKFKQRYSKDELKAFKDAGVNPPPPVPVAPVVEALI